MAARLFMVMLTLAALIGAFGCSRPIVKPQGPGADGGGVGGFPHPGMATGGNISEQDAEVLQAQLKTVYFDFDNYSLSPEAQSALQYNAEILRRTPNTMLIVEGHCDERGTAEYNLALGDRRARAAADFLISMGLPPSQFSIVSYGCELPVDPGHNEAAWAKNRRVYFRVNR